MLLLPLVHLHAAESLNDQKAMRALSQKPAAWGQALTYLLQAQAQDGANTERYRRIAMCLQNTNRPLGAMAWYQAYRMAPGADPQKAEAAGVQVELLDVDVRAKMGNLFTEALALGEKQIKDKVALNGRKYTTTHNLFLLPVLQAEAGLPVEALAMQTRIAALKASPENYSQMVDQSLRYQYRHMSLSPRDRYIYAVALVGDAATVQVELNKASSEPNRDEDKNEKAITGFTRHEAWLFLAEIIRFNLSHERNYRLAWAEQITQTDPMENLDARTGEILRQPDLGTIPLALGSLGATVGETLLKVHAMRPANARSEVSDPTRKFVTRSVRQICSMGTMASKGVEYDPMLVRAASRFEANPVVMTDGAGLSWPGIAWALKQKQEGGTGVTDATIALLTGNGMGINDPIPTTRKGSVGNTALHWAVKWNNLGAVQLLLANQADPARKNRQGQTALDLALTPTQNGADPIAVGREIIKRLQQAMPTR
jgi:hypothetical protein